MAYLLDTNILVRFANTKDPGHAVAGNALFELHQRGEEVRITAQNLIEFRAAATRPASVNGLGFDSALADSKAQVFEAKFPLLPDTPDIYPAWKSLVSALGIIGKQVHDARLVAVCHVHGVTHLLTFNTAHFARFAGYGPGLVVVDPASV